MGDHPGWEPGKLKERRQATGLTLEETGEMLRSAAERAGISAPAANFQTIHGHESGKNWPGPDYRRLYCLLYRASEVELGFRVPLPGEQPTPAPLSPLNVDRSTAQVTAVETALGRITAGHSDADDAGYSQRVLDAWRRRHTGGDPHGPMLTLVGGYAGSGKTELGRFLSALTGWPLLDKDSLTRPITEGMLTALGADPHDRHTSVYLDKVRPLEYRCLMEAAQDHIECGISTILAAPFIAEMTREDWLQRLIYRCRAKRVGVALIWVQCDVESMREYIEFRSAARDAWKLSNWTDYAAGIDVDLRPVLPHLLVDNRYGAAIAIADQARDALNLGISL